jgi:hypothetical protein
VSPQKLWRASLDGKEIRAEQHHLYASQDSGDLFSAELRIAVNGDIAVRELFQSERRLHLRSMELFQKLTSNAT